MVTHPSSDAGSSPSTANNTAPPPASPLPAVDAAKLREAIADVVKSTRNAAPTPAMKFGQYVRQAVDASPKSTEGVLAIGKLLKLDPVSREIDQLKAQIANTDRETGLLRHQVHQLQSQTLGAKRQSTLESKAKVGHGKKRRKKVTLREAGEKLRAKVNAIVVQMSKAGRTEGEIKAELIEKVYSLYDYQHAQECGYSESAARTFRRTPEYVGWASYRTRGNSARLDPDSPAIDFTSGGGKSSKTGMTRNAEFAAKNKLGIGGRGKLPELDAEARRVMAKVPGAAEWYERNRGVLDEPADSEEFADNP